MKKFYSFILTAFIFFTGANIALGAQAFGRTPTVTEKTANISVDTGDTAVILEVYDTQGKRVAGPQTTTGTSPINASIDIYNLSRNAEYVLKGKDRNANLGGDTFEVTFRTISTDTRSPGTGNFYYSTSDDITLYDTDRPASFYQFTTRPACDTSRTKKIDSLRKKKNDVGTAYTNIKITPCFELNKTPTVPEFTARLEDIDTVLGSELYYFTYRSTNDVFARSVGYDTPESCAAHESIYEDKVVQKCTASTTAPVRPTNWNDIINNLSPQGTNIFNDDYNLLAPIGTLETIDNDTTTLADYLNIIFKIAIGLCGALAVIMIVINGVILMGEESVFGRTEAKDRIVKAIMGLLLALGSYAILNTINPDFVDGGFSIRKVSVEIEGDVDAPVTINKPTAASLGILCSGGGKNQIPSIVKTFANKMTYSMEIPKGQVGPNNTIKLDCSGFVNYVLSCAGVDTKSAGVNGGTFKIFSNAEKISSINGTMVNGQELKIGDLVGWKAKENGEKFGHVLIYIGGGQFADSHGGEGRKPGKALGLYGPDEYKSRIKYVKRM